MNFIERYVKFAEPLTEAPRQFHYYMGYMLLSCAVNRKAFYSGSGSFPMSPNLWFILIGPSSITKKSTMLNIGLHHVLAKANITCPRKLLDGTTEMMEFENYSHGGSQENFLEKLSERPVGILAHSEFYNFMDWINRDYNKGLVGILTDLFDQPALRKHSVGTRAKRTDYRIENPFLNIAAVTNIDWMNETLKEAKIAGGFIPRFNLILSKDSGKDIPETPDINTNLQNELVWELEAINATNYGQMRYDDQARKAYSDWYLNFKQNYIRKVSANLVPCLDRRMADLHKFAMLNCIMRNPGIKCTTMNIEDLDMAISAIENIAEFTSQIICDKIALNPYQVDRNRILANITRIAGNNGGCPHSALLRNIKMKSRYAKEILESLSEEGTIRVELDRSGPRIKTLYHLVKET